MNPTICVIDDDLEVCDVLRITLETRNYRVVCAHDGHAGLEQVLAHRPDLVLLDVMMPGLNGYEVLTRIRQHPEVGATPVIVLTCLTAGSTVTDQEWRDRIGASDFLSKPFDPVELVRRIETILKKTSDFH